MTRPRAALAAVLLGVLFLAAGLAAGVGAGAEPQGQDPRQRAQQLLQRVSQGGSPLTEEELAFVLRHAPGNEVEVRYVTLAAVVLDREGHPVRNLTRENFQVLEDGEPRPVVWLDEEPRAPFRLALLVDASTSMQPQRRRAQLRRALLPLMRGVRHSDALRLFRFSEGDVEPVSGWVPWPMTILDEASAIRGSGKTALLDALAQTSRRLPRVSADRHVVLIVTDGIDNASRLRPDEVIAAARSVSAPVYAITLGGAATEIQARRGEARDLEVLETVARQTGGRAFVVGPGSTDEPAAVADRILQDLRHQYLLGFEPGSGGMSGAIRQLEVRVDVPGVQVLARKGYRR